MGGLVVVTQWSLIEQRLNQESGLLTLQIKFCPDRRILEESWEFTTELIQFHFIMIPVICLDILKRMKMKGAEMVR